MIFGLVEPRTQEDSGVPGTVTTGKEERIICRA
jgi:hypothetical protein